MTAAELVQADTAAEAAAVWWAQQIGAPTFDAIGNTGTPREQFEMGFAGALMSEIADRSPVTDEQGQRFAELLAERVAARLDVHETRNYLGHVSLGTDYAPERELAEVAGAAGVSLDRFPWKTQMWIYPDHVVASLGYAAAPQLVWRAPDWQHPVCGQQRYEETPDGYERRDELCGLLRYHQGGCGDWQPDTRRCDGCGRSYSEHYAQQDEAGYTHSWKPGGVR